MRNFLYSLAAILGVTAASVALADAKKFWAREITIPKGKTSATVHGAWGGNSWASLARLVITNESASAITFTLKKIELGNEVTVASSGEVAAKTAYSFDWARDVVATNSVSDFVVSASSDTAATNNLSARVLIYAE